MAYKNLEKKKAWEAARYKDPVFLARRKAYLEATRERRRESQRQYRITHAKELRDYKRVHHEHIAQQHREYFARNIETWRERARKNHDKIRAYYSKWAKEYYKLHPEKRWSRQHPQSPEHKRMLARNWYRNNKGRAQQRLRARKAKMKGSESAAAFYSFVRSKHRIPCYYCGKIISGKKAHIDHVIALNKNGNHASENLCASCPKCNLRKQALFPSEIRFLDQPLLNL